MLKKLVTYSKDNAIAEATFSLFLDKSISKSQDFEELLNYGLKDFFHQFQIVEEKNVALQDNNYEISTRSNAGFIMTGFENDKRRWVIQTRDTPVYPTLSIHCLKYKNWEDFFETVKKILFSISKFRSNIYVNFFSLSYVDKFNWLDQQLPVMSEIFKANQFLPEAVLNTNQVWTSSLVINKDKLMKNDTNFSYTDKIDISTYRNPEKDYYSINLVHNTILSFGTTEKLEKLLETKTLSKALEFCHTNNKVVVKSILQKPVLEKMGILK